MDRPVDFEKTSWEEYPIDLDFTGKLPPGSTSLTSITFTAKGYLWPRGAKTAAPSVIGTPTGTVISGIKGRVSILAGTDGQAYDIIGRAVTNDGKKIEGVVTMLVRDN
jgi:hypothetical protein